MIINYLNDKLKKENYVRMTDKFLITNRHASKENVSQDSRYHQEVNNKMSKVVPD